MLVVVVVVVVVIVVVIVVVVVVVKKVKISLLQAVEAPMVARDRGSHIT
jgi:hypothetical protein